MDSLSLPSNEGYPHPVFAAPSSYLDKMYTHHCRGNLTATDSYLLFLAILHSTGKVEWKSPVSLDPNCPRTVSFIENNLGQLLAVIEKTKAILHPSFEQPNYVVGVDNSSLGQLPAYIKAWNTNIANFYRGSASIREQEEIQKVENRLTWLLLSGDPIEKFSHVIANWAEKASGEFPAGKEELYKQVIRTCFNSTKMFSTPLPLLKEIKECCEATIEVGSIHFHALMQVLKEGIGRHCDYLGGSSLALGYTLESLSSSNLETIADDHAEGTTSGKSRQQARADLASLASNAPAVQPVAGDYATPFLFLKAKLAYRVAKEAHKQSAKEENRLVVEEAIKAVKAEISSDSSASSDRSAPIAHIRGKAL